MEWCFQADLLQQHWLLPAEGKSYFQLKDKGHPNGPSLPHSVPVLLQFHSSCLQGWQRAQRDWYLSDWIPWTARIRILVTFPFFLADCYTAQKPVFWAWKSLCTLDFIPTEMSVHRGVIFPSLLVQATLLLQMLFWRGRRPLMEQHEEL